MRVVLISLCFRPTVDIKTRVDDAIKLFMRLF